MCKNTILNSNGKNFNFAKSNVNVVFLLKSKSNVKTISSCSLPSHHPDAILRFLLPEREEESESFEQHSVFYPLTSL
jgi:hypothetical protein